MIKNWGDALLVRILHYKQSVKNSTLQNYISAARSEIERNGGDPITAEDAKQLKLLNNKIHNSKAQGELETTEEEIRRMTQAPKGPLSAAQLKEFALWGRRRGEDIKFLLDTKLACGICARPGEVSLLRKKDFYQENGIWYANVPHKARGELSKRNQGDGKYDDRKVLAMAVPLLELMLAELDDDSYVFKKGWYNWLRRVLPLAAVELGWRADVRYTPHSLRYSGANIAQQTAGIDAVSEYTGHDTIAMAEKYAMSAREIAAKHRAKVQRLEEQPRRICKKPEQPSQRSSKKAKSSKK
jgi:integrase